MKALRIVLMLTVVALIFAQSAEARGRHHRSFWGDLSHHINIGISGGWTQVPAGPLVIDIDGGGLVHAQSRIGPSQMGSYCQPIRVEQNTMWNSWVPVWGNRIDLNPQIYNAIRLRLNARVTSLTVTYDGIPLGVGGDFTIGLCNYPDGGARELWITMVIHNIGQDPVELHLDFIVKSNVGY